MTRTDILIEIVTAIIVIGSLVCLVGLAMWPAVFIPIGIVILALCIGIMTAS